jgi:GNAT superfamily N-acetyltransferase
LTLEPQNRVDESTIDSAISVITLAFSATRSRAGPIPTPTSTTLYFPPFIRAFAGGAFEVGTAFLAGGFAGAALWLPPGVHPDEDAMNAIMQASIPEDRADLLGEFVAQQARDPPGLPSLVPTADRFDPVQQGRGVGSRLLQRSLAECDREGYPAYLESTSESSRKLYERHGFETVAEIRVEGSPPMWPMLRQPR